MPAADEPAAAASGGSADDNDASAQGEARPRPRWPPAFAPRRRRAHTAAVRCSRSPPRRRQARASQCLPAVLQLTGMSRDEAELVAMGYEQKLARGARSAEPADVAAASETGVRVATPRAVTPPQRPHRSARAASRLRLSLFSFDAILPCAPPAAVS